MTTLSSIDKRLGNIEQLLKDFLSSDQRQSERSRVADLILGGPDQLIAENRKAAARRRKKK